MSHLHLQIEGLWCNNHSFYTSRALTPEANIALARSSNSSVKAGFALTRIKSEPSVYQTGSPYRRWDVCPLIRKMIPAALVGQGSAVSVSFFPPTAMACAGSCTREGGKKQDHLSCWQTTAQTSNSSSCFTSCWAWITIVCNTGYWSKMASVSGIFSISGYNSWQFSCCCMDGWAIPEKSVESLSNCSKISWTPEGSILPYSKKPKWYIFLNKFKFQTQKVTEEKKNQRLILENKGKYVTTMIRVTRSVRVPDGRSQSLSALKENELGLQLFLVENLDYGKNNLGHILPIKLSEVLWDKEMNERIPGQIPPWLLLSATNFAANSCSPLAPSEHLLNNFKYIPLPYRH